jgi:hypothetical protein
MYIKIAHLNNRWFLRDDVDVMRISYGTYPVVAALHLAGPHGHAARERMREYVCVHIWRYYVGV